jgi:hypothetical protein
MIFYPGINKARKRAELLVLEALFMDGFQVNNERRECN